jgi:hypothetical protein
LHCLPPIPSAKSMSITDAETYVMSILSAPPLHSGSAAAIDLASLRGGPVDNPPAPPPARLSGSLVEVAKYEEPADNFEHLLHSSSIFKQLRSPPQTSRRSKELSDEVAAAATNWMGTSGERWRSASRISSYMVGDGKQVPLLPSVDQSQWCIPGQTMQSLVQLTTEPSLPDWFETRLAPLSPLKNSSAHAGMFGSLR